MFRRILVPVDGSATSNRGLRMAIALARDQKAALELLHVVDELLVTPMVDGGVYVSPQYVDDFAAALRTQGAKVLERAEAQARKAGIGYRAVLAETVGRPVAELIVAHAKRCRADLIVLGTHGRRGLARAVMGSDAEGVVRMSPVPVMLVRLGTATAARQRKASARRSTNS
jgi:nucleotide-binding universal stress UspA family protein